MFSTGFRCHLKFSRCRTDGLDIRWLCINILHPLYLFHIVHIDLLRDLKDTPRVNTREGFRRLCYVSSLANLDLINNNQHQLLHHYHHQKSTTTTPPPTPTTTLPTQALVPQISQLYKRINIEFIVYYIFFLHTLAHFVGDINVYMSNN